MALPFTDTFTQSTGADQAITTYNAGWLVDTGGFSVVDATDDVVASTGGTENVAYWNTDVPNADQAVSFVISAVSTGIYPGVVARRVSAGNYYTLYVDSGNYYVSRYDSSSEVVLRAGTATTTAAGDVFKIEVSGTGATVTIKVYRAAAASPTTFVQLGADISDTAANRKTSAGFGGIISYSANSSSRITAFTVENLGAAATVDQEGARLGADDGSESAHTWLAAQDANATVAVGTAFLMRMLLNGTGDAASASHVLRYQKNGTGGFVPVPVGSGNAEVLAQPTWGAVGTAGSGTTSCTPAYPTGITAATSKLFCAVTGRSNTANTVPTMPAGWTRIGGLEDGTGTWAVDTGPRRVNFFQKDVTDGTETGTVTVSLSGTTANTLRASIFRIEVPSGYLVDVALGTGADTSNDTSYSAASSTSLDLDADRLLVLATAQNLDTGTATSRAVSASGITFGTLTNRADTAVTNGNDHRHIVNSVPVSSGSGTVAPTFSYTVSAAASGPTAFLVLRARLAAVTNEIYVAPSANIAAGGEATTARLTAPSGKTTADFVTGRRWDDENGTDAIDLTTDDYTEFEWSINTQAPAANGDAFEFRVYAGAAALDTYTVTPQVTLGAAATPSPPIRIPAARLAPLLHF